RDVRGDDARCRARHEEAAVRVRLGGGRAEPAVGQREGVGQRVVEGQIVLGVVAHRAGTGAGEAVHGATVDLEVRVVPGLTARVLRADGTGLVVGVHALGADGVPVDR